MLQGIVENNEAWPLISEIELLNVSEEKVNEGPTHTAVITGLLWAQTKLCQPEE